MDDNLWGYGLSTLLRPHFSLKKPVFAYTTPSIRQIPHFVHTKDTLLGLCGHVIKKEGKTNEEDKRTFIGGCPCNWRCKYAWSNEQGNVGWKN
jgi:hypothetical protein